MFFSKIHDYCNDLEKMTGMSISTRWITMRCIVKGWLRFWFSAATPRVFSWAEKLKNGADSRTVSSNTDIVVEGYPRCGNSFVFSIIQRRSDRPLRIAHHIHLPAQIELGIARSLPVLVLVREPEGAIGSFVALQLQAGIREGKFHDLSDADLVIRIRDAAIYYVQFYKRIVEIKQGFLLAHFELIVRDVSKILEALNACYGFNFNSMPIDEHEKKHVFSVSGFHLSPSTERNNHKERIAVLYPDAVTQILQQHTKDIYQALLSHPGMIRA